MRADRHRWTLVRFDEPRRRESSAHDYAPDPSDEIDGQTSRLLSSRSQVAILERHKLLCTHVFGDVLVVRCDAFAIDRSLMRYMSNRKGATQKDSHLCRASCRRSSEFLDWSCPGRHIEWTGSIRSYKLKLNRPQASSTRHIKDVVHRDIPVAFG